MIVSLLDLHPAALQDDEKLEILEAGTGHGALTIHLARAIAGANGPCPPPIPSTRPDTSVTGEAAGEANPTDGMVDETLTTTDEAAADFDAWKQRRRAIVHTLDISSKHSKHAKKTIFGFRHGLYFPHIDFHTGLLSNFLSSREPESLAHCFLDLPSCEDHIEEVGERLQIDGCLLVFTPSVTQITRCVELIRNKKLPLVMEQCLELGPGLSGGRLWDVRVVKPRVLEKLENGAKLQREDPREGASESGSEPLGGDDLEPDQLSSPERPEGQITEDYKFVCRPKVGERTQGGGFLAMWRKMKPKEGYGSKRSDNPTKEDKVDNIEETIS